MQQIAVCILTNTTIMSWNVLCWEIEDHWHADCQRVSIMMRWQQMFMSPQWMVSTWERDCVLIGRRMGDVPHSDSHWSTLINSDSDWSRASGPGTGSQAHGRVTLWQLPTCRKSRLACWDVTGVSWSGLVKLQMCQMSQWHEPGECTVSLCSQQMISDLVKFNVCKMFVSAKT